MGEALISRGRLSADDVQIVEHFHENISKKKAE